MKLAERITEEFSKFFGLGNHHEEYDYDPNQEPDINRQVEIVEEARYKPEQPVDNEKKSLSFSKKKKNSVKDHLENPQVPQTTPIKPVENVRVSNKVVQMNQPTAKTNPIEMQGENTVSKITILEPRTYTEAKDIAKCIFRNEIVIVKFHLVEESQARRIVDFLTGTVFALDGDIQRLAEEIFICTPPNMEIDGVTAKNLMKNQFDL